MENWKNSTVNTDSLWILGERDKAGKHSNCYHGNFIPQIPNQLILRYTKENDTVLDVFMGSGTTLFECETLDRKFIGFDINSEILGHVKQQMETSDKSRFTINECDVSDEKLFNSAMRKSLAKLHSEKVQFIIAHPPYMDIVKFTEKPEDLSHIGDLSEFLTKFVQIMRNALPYLENNKYFGIVVGDVYKKSEVVPLAFHVLDSIKQNFKVKLKGIVVKNIEGNRGKLGSSNIWKYRALKSDYFIFKHEYILVFKKEHD
jgi:DNA modification methylase